MKKDEEGNEEGLGRMKKDEEGRRRMRKDEKG